MNELPAAVDEFVAQGAHAQAIHGRAETYLDAVVQQAAGVPLFMFVPCGLGVPHETLRKVLTGPRSVVFPATEVLMNFSDKAIRHIGGQLPPAR